MRRATALALVALCAFGAAACRKKKPPEALEQERFSEEELWSLAQKEMGEEDHKKASAYLKLLLDQYPTGPHVREAHLLYADALFARGSDANLIEAQAKYLSYLSFYPEDARADYAQFRVAMCAFQRRGKPNRDQSVTRDAINEMEKLLLNQPRTSYADEARARIRDLKDELAMHELAVSTFYDRRGWEDSSVRRLKFLLDKYPDYSRRDEVYYALGTACLDAERADEAVAYLEKLLAEFPDSPRAGDGRDLLEDARKAAGRVAEKEAAPSGGEAATAGDAPPREGAGAP
jgi:outer membrane protein assembly factor BamD